MPKRKCNFTEDLRKKYPCFRPGRDKWEAECTVCKAGTYVSVANKGANDLQAHIDTIKHKTAVQGESTSAKVTEYFVRRGKGVDLVNAAAFHTVKHHNSYRSMDCTSTEKSIPRLTHGKKVFKRTHQNRGDCQQCYSAPKCSLRTSVFV